MSYWHFVHGGFVEGSFIHEAIVQKLIKSGFVLRFLSCFGHGSGFFSVGGIAEVYFFSVGFLSGSFVKGVCPRCL